MSSERVSDDFDDELLSAYVDGELTAGERALVEARLRSDPRAARLVTELRSLSKAINSLPHETLGEDLRLRVQAEIEEARSAAAAEVLPMTPPYDRWNGIRRGLWWSAAAIAATVALVMMTPKNATRNERDIAQREQEVGHPAAKANKQLADDEVPPGLAGSMRAMNGPKPALAPVAGVQPPEPADQPSTVASDESLTRAPAGEMSDRRPNRELKDGAAGRLAVGEAVPGAAATAAKPAAPQQMAKEPVQSSAPPATAGADFDRSLDRYDYLGALTQAPPKEVELLLKQPGGAQRFEELLKQQHVQLFDQPKGQSRSDAASKQLAGQDKKAQEKLAEQPAGKNQRTGGELNDQVAELSAGAPGERQRSFGASDLRAFDTEAPPAEERIVVEATPAEIEKLLAACVADKDFFATTAHDRQEVEQLGANRRAAEASALGKPSSLGGAVGGGVSGKKDKSGLALDAAGDAAKVPEVGQKDQLEMRRSGGEPSVGRAWRLPPLASDDASFFSREVNGKAKTEEAVRLRDKNAAASATVPVDRATNAGAPMALKQLAKEADKPANKTNDKVQVVFVLRRAAMPAASSAATATGAAAAPAANSAAPAETTPAKPQ